MNAPHERSDAQPFSVGCERTLSQEKTAKDGLNRNKSQDATRPTSVNVMMESATSRSMNFALRGSNKVSGIPNTSKRS
eukprot:746087-Hanusia_phi.AAC.3